MNIVLDTNIIIRYPEILSVEKEGVNFYIPTTVINQLRNVNPNLTRVLEDIQNKSIIIQDFPVAPKTINAADLVRIGVEDYAIMEVTKELKSEYSDVKIATEDLRFKKVLEENGVITLSLAELKKKLNVGSRKEETHTAEKIKDYKKAERKRLIQGILIGLVSSIMANIIYNNLDLIISTINVWGTITLVILLGIGLFLFRERYRLAYGITEFSIGFIAVVSIFYPEFNYDEINVDIVFGLKLFGSLYIMVRGQDNILKSLNGTTIGEKIKQKIRREASR